MSASYIFNGTLRVGRVDVWVQLCSSLVRVGEVRLGIGDVFGNWRQ